MTAGELWERVWPWIVILSAAGAHELGHWLAARLLGIEVRGLRLDLLGARMELMGLLSYGQEMAVAAAGPFVNLVCAAMAYPAAAAGAGEAVSLLCAASAVLGCVNLLPVGTLDGGRILRAGIARRWGDRAAAGALRGTTAVCLGLLWLACAYGLLRGGQLLSGFVFSLCLLWRVAAGRE
jgi:stage IV sporulation protein FB